MPAEVTQPPAPEQDYILSHAEAVRIWEHLRDNTNNASWFWRTGVGLPRSRPSPQPQPAKEQGQPCFGKEYDSDGVFCLRCKVQKECWVVMETGSIPSSEQHPPDALAELERWATTGWNAGGKSIPRDVLLDKIARLREQAKKGAA